MSELRKTYPGGVFFITLTVVGWIDVFSRPAYADILFKNLKYCQEHKGLEVYAYVLMSNHLHLIVSTRDNGNLSNILRDFKSYTAKQILKEIEENKRESRREWLLYLFKRYGQRLGRGVQFWLPTNHPTDLYSPSVIEQKMNYIHMNPVRARITSEPEHYLYSSAHPYPILKINER